MIQNVHITDNFNSKILIIFWFYINIIFYFFQLHLTLFTMTQQMQPNIQIRWIQAQTWRPLVFELRDVFYPVFW